MKWTVDGTFGATSIATGVFIASWNTAWNTPSEWGASWSGFGKRFGSREAQMTISNAVEAGLGAAWGEDLRYFPSGDRDLGANRVRGEDGVRCPPPQRSVGSCVGALCRCDRQQRRCEHLASLELDDGVAERAPDRQRIPWPVRREHVE